LHTHGLGNGENLRIMLLVMYFPPEIGSASHLFYEFARGLMDRDHKVTVVTTFPRKYNLAMEDARLPSKYRRRFFLKEKFDGINVIRLRSPAPQYSPTLRGMEHFVVPLLLLLGGIFSKSDIIIVYTPPLPIVFAGWFLSKIKRIPLIITIQDLYPQAIIDLGFLKNPLLIKIFRVLEKLIYVLSDKVVVYSESNKRYISTKIYQEKIAIIPNWHDRTIKVLEKNNELRKKLDIEDKFVIAYAGIMSFSQDLETVVNVAKILKEEKNIVFLLVGDGPQKKAIEKKINSLKLSNVIMLPFQPRETYSKLLAAADVCLVTLDKNKVTYPAVPRKLNDIMAAGRAVIANVPMEGDVPEIIQEAKCGYCVKPKNPKNFAETILMLYNRPDLVENLGKNGAIYAKNNFAIEICCSKYEKLFKSLINNSSN
jgi:glycosyltransferase involved in cell wall biosynthesis